MAMTVFMIPPAFAGPQEILESAGKAVTEVVESSRPAFGTDEMRQPARPADKFLTKLREKRTDFMEGRKARRERFFDRLAEEGLSSREQKEKISRFHRKEQRKLEKFLEKERRKREKKFQKEPAGK